MLENPKRNDYEINNLITHYGFILSEISLATESHCSEDVLAWLNLRKKTIESDIIKQNSEDE